MGLPLVLLVLPLFAPSRAAAHPPGFGLLDLAEQPAAGPDVPVRWEVQLRVAGAPAVGLALTPRWPEGCTAEPPRVAVVSTGVDRRWTLRCPPGPLRGSLGVEGRLDAQLVVRIRPRDAGAAIRTAALDARSPELALGDTAPVLPRYLRLGTEHVLGGADHLLFVLGWLVLLGQRRRRLLLALTAFTLGHSVTLALAALGVLPVAGAGAEAVIALSLVLLAFELDRGPPSLTHRHPAFVAGAFGLVHGLGFAGALREAGLPEGAVVPALLGFNLGVEAGQLAFVAVVLALAALARRRLPEALLRRVVVYALGVAGSTWLLRRLGALLAG
ncbi:MAG: HupE/UreJ family protein [Myxococcota bacterium]